MKSINVKIVRKDFPAINQRVNNNNLVYLDNAATTHKPKSVIDNMVSFYSSGNSNIHRSMHTLGYEATRQFEDVRRKVKMFINAYSVKECIFVKGATEAINLVAESFLLSRISSSKEILITYMEHHSNIVPWQIVCKKTGAKLRAISISSCGEIALEDYEKKLNENTMFVSLIHVSNVLGTINPICEMIEMAHSYGAFVLIDGTQAVPHMPIDVKRLGCDFYVFSGHKVYGPTGVGILWGKECLLDDMVPYQYGGRMINSVTIKDVEYASLPYKFESGTQNISGVIGLGSAIDYFTSLDINLIVDYESYLLRYLINAMSSLNNEFSIIGTSFNKVPIISFVHKTIHSHDIDTMLDSYGIAVRSGHHCAMPLMSFLGLSSTTRISLSFYNTTEEIDFLIESLSRVKSFFK
ncbi:SufS family cysteine desulfurase [Candidatus Legionella polyplacis]|uniref:Cysteine desulfurase n=1 Tax=Candidatus Legionella polyplacis TaxID=2005262 RepID=A0ABZ2GZI8_9GAMM